MQAPDEGAGSAVGDAEGLGGQSSPRRRDCPGGPDAPRSPRGPQGQEAPDEQGAPGVPDGQGGPGREQAGAAAAALPQGEPAPRALGPGGDAAPVAAGPGRRLLEFTLTVPFLSPLEAEMAYRSLAPEAQRHRGAIQKEFTVNGSALAVWTAEDPDVFRFSINTFLIQLSLVIRNIRRLGVVAPLRRGRGRRLPP